MEGQSTGGLPAGGYAAPEYYREDFHCPHCGVYAHQLWFEMWRRRAQRNTQVLRGAVSVCVHCQREALWFNDQMVYPAVGLGPPPHNDMPAKVREDYLDARAIGHRSPRGAGALLRLAVQKLCQELGRPGKNLNDDIAELVKQGLSPVVQQSLDSLRVIGNNAVHPGEIDLKDDRETVGALFAALNVIVEQIIAGPKQAQQLFDRLPQSAKDQIAKRDAAT